MLSICEIRFRVLNITLVICFRLLNLTILTYLLAEPQFIISGAMLSQPIRVHAKRVVSEILIDPKLSYTCTV